MRVAGGSGGGCLTFVVVRAVLPPPLQLLAVIVEALQAHDAIMQTHSAGPERRRCQRDHSDPL